MWHSSRQQQQAFTADTDYIERPAVPASFTKVPSVVRQFANTFFFHKNKFLLLAAPCHALYVSVNGNLRLIPLLRQLRICRLPPEQIVYAAPRTVASKFVHSNNFGLCSCEEISAPVTRGPLVVVSSSH